MGKRPCYNIGGTVTIKCLIFISFLSIKWGNFVEIQVNLRTPITNLRRFHNY